MPTDSGLDDKKQGATPQNTAGLTPVVKANHKPTAVIIVLILLAAAAVIILQNSGGTGPQPTTTTQQTKMPQTLPNQISTTLPNQTHATLADQATTPLLPTQPTPKIPDLKQCTNLSGKDRDDCVLGLAHETNDSRYCFGLPDNSSVSRCLEKIATATGNVSVCDDITFVDWRQLCFKGVQDRLFFGNCAGLVSGRDECIINLAHSSSNPRYCTALGGNSSISRCLMDLASVTGNVTVCDGITFADWRQSCVKGVQDRLLLGNCSGLQTGRDECLLNLAHASNDPKYCSGLGDNSSVSRCLEDVALAAGDAKVCDGIAFDDWRRSCTKKAQDKLLFGNCAGIMTGRDECIMGLARENRDHRYCAGLADNSSLSRCLADVASASADESVCNGIPFADWRLSCVKGVRSSLLLGNCFGLPAGRSECVMGLARESGDQRYCAGLGDNSSISRCLDDLAITTGNVSLCGGILYADWRGACVNNVSKAFNTAKNEN